MKPQRVGTVGGRGESGYLRGRRGRQQAWGGGTGRGAPTGQDGPLCTSGSVPRTFCDKAITHSSLTTRLGGR